MLISFLAVAQEVAEKQQAEWEEKSLLGWMYFFSESTFLPW